MVVVPARQATYAGGINSFESILALLWLYDGQFLAYLLIEGKLLTIHIRFLSQWDCMTVKNMLVGGLYT
jgi:hypothetical protein